MTPIEQEHQPGIDPPHPPVNVSGAPDGSPLADEGTGKQPSESEDSETEAKQHE